MPTSDARATQPIERIGADARPDPPLHVVLVEPEIPPNTGNVARMCAATGCALHLIEPLGFSIADRELKRAGLDYWESVDVRVHASFEAFVRACDARLWLLSTRASTPYARADFRRGDALVFGKETAGLPQALLDAYPASGLRVPMRAGAVRSLNLSTTAGIVTYAALAKLDFPRPRMMRSIADISADVIVCRRCPELRAYCDAVATEKRRAYRDQTYWGRPVPAFGDPDARLALVGLAPGAHGSNRTGRMFTGDASGEWLYRALFRAGFANQPDQRDRDDGLVLHDALITAAGRCAPPQNKPTPAQLANCFPFLVAEIEALRSLRAIVGLGAIGTKAATKALVAAGYVFDRIAAFSHGAESVATRGERRVVLLASYHPSRQNTNTGVLTQPMLDAIFARARELVSA